MKLEKDHYYLIKEPLLTRIKVVTVVDNYVGYIYANARKNMEKMLIYIDIATSPFEIVKDLGTNPDFSDDDNYYMELLQEALKHQKKYEV